MKTYNFNISLSILNHLGRNLYRSFMTVLGEAISNAWDADAHNVYITIERDNRKLVIIDDGDGMDEIVSNYSIRNIPVLAFIKNGKLLNKNVGLVDKVKITELINNNL